MLFDAHNHLHDAWLLPHHAEIFPALARISLRGAVVNGTCENDWPDVTALCAPTSPFARLAPALRLLPSYGLHPWHVGNATPAWRATFRRALDVAPSAAVGEIGLDRWILDRAKPDDPRLIGLRRASLDEQLDAFVWQLNEAAVRNLPVTIHCLDAWGSLATALRATPLPACGFLLHAYAGSLELARELLPLGAYFSFNGAFLAERQAAKRAVFAQLPLDRVLVETDAPAMPLPPEHATHSLPPLADGTTPNHPANLASTYAAFARIRNLDTSTLADLVAQNFTRLFGPRLDPQAPNSKP